MPQFFRLERDSRIPYAVYFPYPNLATLRRELLQGVYSGLKKSAVIILPPNKYYNYNDVLDQQLYMIRASVKQTFDFCLPHAKYSTIYLMDQKNKTLSDYYAPHLPFIDCLSEKCKCNLDKSVFEKIVLKKDAIGNLDIFQVLNVNTNLVIVSLAVAECILRRNPNGIKLTRIFLEEDVT